MMVARQNDKFTFGPGPISESSIAPSLSLSLSPIPTISDSDTFTPTGTSDSLSSTTTTPISTPTSTSGSSPFWTFATPANAVTCQPYQIQWSVSDTNSPTDLSNTLLVLSLSNTTTALNLNLTTTQPLLTDNYTWPLVTVPEGTYTLQGTAVGTGATDLLSPTQSYVLSVKSGSDTSCIGNNNNTNTGTPVAKFSKSTGTNKAAIAGGTIGGIILAVLISMMAFTLYRLRKNPFRRTAGGVRGALPHKDWNGLSSVDSKFPIADNERTRSRSVPGSVLGGESEAEDRTGIGAGTMTPGVLLSNIRPSRHVSQDMDSLSSLEGEKTTESLGVEALPVLMRDGNRGGGDVDGNEYVFETDIAHARAHGGGAFPRPVEMAHLPSRAHGDSDRSSSEFDPYSAFPTAVGTTTTTARTRTVGQNADDVDAHVKANRRVSRTPRKPVPAYEPMPEEMDVQVRRDRSLSRTRSSAHGHASAGSPMEYDMDAHAMLHGLQAKSSGQFGMMEGQGMHFLIPDMPPVVQGERGGVDE